MHIKISVILNLKERTLTYNINNQWTCHKLVISNIIKSVKKYLTDCFCKNRKITYQIDDSNNDFEQFELSDNNHTQYVSL